MHIPDGVLTPPVIAATGILAAGGVAIGLRRMDYERIPRVGVLASAFFVASLVHVPVGPSSVHLVLNGLMGIVLGWEAFPAIAVALFLQAVLFGYGGLWSLGANIVNMAVPAVVCYYLFARAVSGGNARVFAAAAASGAFAVMMSTGLLAAILYFTGKAFFQTAIPVYIGHIPVMIIEAFVAGAVVVFLKRVRPEMLAHGLQTEASQ